MMIQQILPPQKPLLLHIYTTSEKFFSGTCRSFQDIPEGEIGAKKAGVEHRLFILHYPHKLSGYLPSAVSCFKAAMTVGLSAA